MPVSPQVQDMQLGNLMYAVIKMKNMTLNIELYVVKGMKCENKYIKSDWRQVHFTQDVNQDLDLEF